MINSLIGLVIKYVMEWLTKAALKWVMKESKINKDKEAIDDQLTRLDDEVKKVESGESKDTKELIDAARNLARNF